MAEPVVVDDPLLTSPTSRVRFRPLTYRREGPEYVVGCREISVYLTMPPVGVDVIRALQEGATVGDVERRYAGAPPDQRPDVRDLVATLAGIGFVAEIDGRPVEYQAPEPEEGEGVAVFRGLRGEHVRWLYGRPALLLHAAAFLAVLVLLAFNPRFFPLSRDFFVLPWYSLNTALVVLTCGATLFVHELSHVAAARAMGIDARVNVGRRLWALIAQSNLGDIWELSRGARVVVYLSGIIVNVWIFLAALVTALLIGPSTFQHWLRLLMVFQFYSIAWQLVFFTKTDLHYALADLFYARNLMEQSREYLESIAGKIIPGLCQSDLSDLPVLERRFIKVYAWASVVGLAIALGLFAGYILPYFLRTIVGALLNLLAARSTGLVVDSVVTLAGFGINFALIGYVLWRDHLRRLLRRQAPEPALEMPTA